MDGNTVTLQVSIGTDVKESLENETGAAEYLEIDPNEGPLAAQLPHIWRPLRIKLTWKWNGSSAKYVKFEVWGTRKSRLQKKKDLLAEIEKELREGPKESKDLDTMATCQKTQPPQTSWSSSQMSPHGNLLWIVVNVHRF